MESIVHVYLVDSLASQYSISANILRDLLTAGGRRVDIASAISAQEYPSRIHLRSTKSGDPAGFMPPLGEELWGAFAQAQSPRGDLIDDVRLQRHSTSRQLPAGIPCTGFSYRLRAASTIGG
jgi:hypothetical protein